MSIDCTPIKHQPISSAKNSKNTSRSPQKSRLLAETTSSQLKRLEKLNYSAKDKKPPLKIKKESKSPSVRDKTPQKQFIEMPDEPPLIPCSQIREIAEPNLISEAETPTNF